MLLFFLTKRNDNPPVNLLIIIVDSPSPFAHWRVHAKCVGLARTIYIRCIRYFWQGNHHVYGHIRCTYTVLADPISVSEWGPKRIFAVHASFDADVCWVVWTHLLLLGACVGAAAGGVRGSRARRGQPAIKLVVALLLVMQLLLLLLQVLQVLHLLLLLLLLLLILHL